MNLRKLSSKSVFAFFAAVLCTCTITVLAQTASSWPDKPIKIIVGYSAGGATDVLARLVAVKMTSTLGQTVIVENKPGANSNVGAELVARAPADGYTLYAYSIANTINMSLYPKLGYDSIKDFEPIGMIAKIPNILVVNPNLPIKTVADYVRYAKDSKDGITFASSGSGSSIHLSGEMFKMQAKIQMLHIPYKGSAPAVTDLLGGQVESCLLYTSPSPRD
jgi:tripartite-type tricarboxylate transporter receptor subunit TctC